MFRKLLFVPVAVAAALIADASFAQSTIAPELQMMKSAEKHGAFIENFAQLARAKKEREILASLDASSINGVSESQLLEAFKEDVFPFFADYERMKNYEQITKAQAPDGRVGLWHYTFIVDYQGNTKPFQIALIDGEGGPKVLSILVGQCVKGRHPAIPPCR